MAAAPTNANRESFSPDRQADQDIVLALTSTFTRFTSQYCFHENAHSEEKKLTDCSTGIALQMQNARLNEYISEMHKWQASHTAQLARISSAVTILLQHIQKSGTSGNSEIAGTIDMLKDSVGHAHQHAASISANMRGGYLSHTLHDVAQSMSTPAPGIRNNGGSTAKLHENTDFHEMVLLCKDRNQLRDLLMSVKRASDLKTMKGMSINYYRSSAGYKH
jgi:hypothetical protein